MTFLEANERVFDTCDTKAMSAFGCTYFHNICIRCKNKSVCYRKEPLIKDCNYYEKVLEASKEEHKGTIDDPIPRPKNWDWGGQVMEL